MGLSFEKLARLVILFSLIATTMLGGASVADGSGSAVNWNLASAARTSVSLKKHPKTVSSTVSSFAPSSSTSASSAVSSAVSSADSSTASSSASSTVSSAASSSPASSTTAAVPPPFTHPARMTVGYYASWAGYSGFTPDKISAANLDVIHYAFAKIGTDLRIIIGDSGIDYTNFAKLKALKTTYPSLKTVISVGGWNDSGRFSDAALTDASRVAFADSVAVFLKTYGFDGVDIDWEYPTGGGLSANVSRTEDRTNFGLLLKALRTRLDSLGAQDGKHYSLSFAGAASSSFASGVGLSGIGQTVDYAVLMTYDLHGSWDSYTDFNAPLYLPAGTSPQYKVSVDGAVRTWLNYGFPAGKLVMGVPFYGYAYQGVTNSNGGLWQNFTSAAAVGYDTVQSKYSGYPKFFESTALVPWLFNGSTFISYEDASSIRSKTQYAVSKNLLGVGAWELSHDRSAVLLRTVDAALG